MITKAIVLCLAMTALFLCGCAIEPEQRSEEDFFGTYVMRYRGVSQKIQLKSDYTFVQRVVYTDGKTYVFKGSYQIGPNPVSASLNRAWSMVDERGGLNKIYTPGNVNIYFDLSKRDGKEVLIYGTEEGIYAKKID